MNDPNLINFSSSIGNLTFNKKENYLLVELLPKRMDKLEEIEQHIHLISENVGTRLPVPTVVDIRALKGISKEVRDLMSKDKKATRQISCLAVIISSGISKIMGNIFMRFSKPDYPTRLFTDKQKAIDWILGQ